MYKLNLKNMLRVISFCVYFFLCSPPVDLYSAEVMITWDKPDDSRVSGYYLYFGESGTDFKSAPERMITPEDQTRCIIYGLIEGRMYDFALTSSDSKGNESDFSETISYRMPQIIPLEDIDNDGDGYTESEGDCDDSNQFIHPNAVENCLDGSDNDCDHETDCYDADCFNDAACRICTDADGDGYYAEDYCGDHVDRDDNDKNIYPGADEITGDESDHDPVDLPVSIIFYEQYYLARYPDVAKAVNEGVFGTGWSHYQQFGRNEGRSYAEPDGYDDFNEEYYLARNSDIARQVRQGIIGTGWEHFIQQGMYEGRSYAKPEGYGDFNETYYLAGNSDVARAVEQGVLGSGWEHYKNYGQYEGRSYAEPDGYGGFNEAYYLAQNNDVARAVKQGVFGSGWEHYKNYGMYEGRTYDKPEDFEGVEYGGVCP